MVNLSKKELWLFDVDGTLVDTTKLHVAVYQDVYEAVTGKKVSEQLIVSRFGLPATEGHEKVLEKAGIEYTKKMVSEIIRLHQERFKELLASVKIVPLGGVVEMLAFLQKEKKVIAVVTGNFKESAQGILRNAGLVGFFSNITGDDGESTRGMLVGRAIEEAKQRNTVGAVIVVGDTPADIRAGRQAGAFTLGVATGNFTINELRQEKPDIAVKSLQHYSGVINAVQKKFGGGRRV